ncbi:hypothetical protein ASD72_05250 [Pseudoxanthomonas sp. Root630]|nr:hypothetical protein ASD72_05250 [Pseudoxanthomonas sp. Root630]
MVLVGGELSGFLRNLRKQVGVNGMFFPIQFGIFCRLGKESTRCQGDASQRREADSANVLLTSDCFNRAFGEHGSHLASRLPAFGASDVAPKEGIGTCQRVPCFPDQGSLLHSFGRDGGQPPSAGSEVLWRVFVLLKANYLAGLAPSLSQQPLNQRCFRAGVGSEQGHSALRVFAQGIHSGFDLVEPIRNIKKECTRRAIQVEEMLDPAFDKHLLRRLEKQRLGWL